MSHQTVRTGRRLYVTVSPPEEQAGARPDCTIFFVHGSMASHEQWRFQMAAVKRFKVVAYDSLGCGLSRGEEAEWSDWGAYATEEHFADLLTLFDREKTRINLIVGHSFGASQVLRLAAARPGEVHGGVLIAPPVLPDGGHPVFYLPVTVLNWIQPHLSAGFIKMALHPETREARTEEHKELLKIAHARSNTNKMQIAKSFYRQIRFANKELVQKIRGETPFLVICGSDDPVTPVAMANTIIEWLNEREGKKGEVTLEVIGPASHQVMEEQPVKVNAAIDGFFDRCIHRMSSNNNGISVL